MRDMQDLVCYTAVFSVITQRSSPGGEEVEADYARPKHFNNLSPKRDQYHQFSQNNITTQSRE